MAPLAFKVLTKPVPPPVEVETYKPPPEPIEYYYETDSEEEEEEKPCIPLMVFVLAIFLVAFRDDL